MLFDAKDMRILLAFHIYSIPMSGLSVSGFTSAIYIASWTRIELCTGRCCYQQRWLQHPQKQMQQRWICFQRWFTPFDSMVTKFVKFSPINHPHRLHFRWRNSTISKISTSFYQALMVLKIRRSAMENADGQLRYSGKRRRGATLHPTPLSRIKMISIFNIFSLQYHLNY